jgi:high-affinity nickel permease
LSFDFLLDPLESVDAWLEGLFAGAPLVVALLIALVLGLRHASDPDHLVAVTSLVAADGGDVRGAARLGAWWGAGHAAALIAIGVPLIVLRSQIPGWLERGAETAVGIVILLLAARIVVKWMRGDFRAGRHPHRADARLSGHRHLCLGRRAEHPHHGLRTSRHAIGIGLLHGLAGTGAVTVLLLAAMPGKLEAAAALAVFAPMSIVSMTLCTSAFAWLLTRRLVDPLFRSVLIPAFGVFGLLFGFWYTGVG